MTLNISSRHVIAWSLICLFGATALSGCQHDVPVPPSNIGGGDDHGGDDDDDGDMAPDTASIAF